MACCALEKGNNGREIVGAIPAGPIPLQTLHELCLQRTDQELLLLWNSLLQSRPAVVQQVGAGFQQQFLKEQEQKELAARLAAEANGDGKPAAEKTESTAPPDEPEKPEPPAPPPEPVAPVVMSTPVPPPPVEVEVQVQPLQQKIDAEKKHLKPHVQEDKPTRYVNGCLPIPSKESSAGKMLISLQKVLSPILNNTVFKCVLVLCVVLALFGAGLATLFDIPDDPGIAAIDITMCAVAVLFAFELIANCIVEYTTYPLSFFFWMDLIGTLSMMFEISFLLGTSGKIQTSTASGTLDAVVVRTARAAKVGARAGRLSKLMKYFDPAPAEANVEAKVLSSKLTLTLSTRVSMLTIVLVMVLPLFQTGQYPETDLSMETWTEQLELSLKQNYDEQIALSGVTSKSFERQVERMIDFYDSVNYKPFKLEGFGDVVDVRATGLMTIAGASLIDHPEPARKSNIYVQEVDKCLVIRESCSGSKKAKVFFDFKVPKQIEAGADMGMVIFIVLCMVVISVVLSYTLDKLVIQPMERMLTTVITLAGDILSQFGMDEDFEGGEGSDETAVIEVIFSKFAKLASLAAQRNEVSDDDLKNMDDATKGVMLQLMDVQQNKRMEAQSDSIANLNAAAVASLPVQKSIIESWNFDVLALSHEQNSQVAIHIFFDSNLGRITGRVHTTPETFNVFHEAAKKRYNNDLPYHNYPHAVDVLHTVYRFLNITHTGQWVSNVEQFAMLVAALCHDLGHQGKTNQFLVEVRDQLALTYNDRSPLENMHAATLFQICSNEEADIFKKMDLPARKLARKVAIAAILHTDNANHYDMVKEISKIYEIGADFCEAQARCPDGEFDQCYLEQILSKNTLLWLELFLHLADVSNCLKPWKICFGWAHRVLDEFFNQGDAEKSLGIPVGMLNDREKINRPGSQHGYIVFMINPFMMNSVKLFRGLHPMYSQMASNLEQWRNLWVEDLKPSQEEIAKKDADITKVKNSADELAQSAAQW
eukprot:TRINITY_DN28235_c0_g1_i1.p1 TRINITY_DN28235_c0_g1~~TRINITY_DN28235_c0_g1_i1.p1  ORF type:complete len:991 (-),score=251.07 TRINITY_DN28235_c0_g1_i1:53-3025(-)